ncbi:MAG: hypothetical protein GC180_12380 [Bacteroidetes bacterium]|nr:hypothetical protein [Bacteroidota bacterium]
MRAKVIYLILILISPLTSHAQTYFGLSGGGIRTFDQAAYYTKISPTINLEWIKKKNKRDYRVGLSAYSLIPYESSYAVYKHQYPTNKIVTGTLVFHHFRKLSLDLTSDLYLIQRKRMSWFAGAGFSTGILSIYKTIDYLVGEEEHVKETSLFLQPGANTGFLYNFSDNFSLNMEFKAAYCWYFGVATTSFLNHSINLGIRYKWKG